MGTQYRGRIDVTAILLSAAVLQAQPVTRSGPCEAATVGRYPPPVYTAMTGAPAQGSGVPSGSIGQVENWHVFPVKPHDTFVTGCHDETSAENCTIQNPMTPEQSINCIEVPEGLKVELWASEKSPGNIRALQDFTFDARGRLWAVEPLGYPNTIRSVSAAGGGKFEGGPDRIVILEDSNGDRVMDTFKVFRHGLSMPQGLEIVPGGLVVAMNPYLVFFPNVGDTAPTHEILWQGMGNSGNFDTHGGVSSLTWGLDNFVYGHIGYNGGACNPQLPGGGGGITCGSGNIWRIKHVAFGSDTTVMQRVSTSGPANAWGIGQMEDGQWFKSAAACGEHSNHQVRFGTPSSNALASEASCTIHGVDDQHVYYPLTRDFYAWGGNTSPDNEWGDFHVTNSSASSGHAFYTSRLLPQKYWNRFAFVCEGSSKLCNQDSMVVHGSSWRAVRMPGPARSNIFASADAWIAPLWAKTGPDGAVWVLDWNNYLFLHNPAQPSGNGSAWHNHLRTKTGNRIYRVAPADGSAEPVLDLTTASLTELVTAFGNPNFLWRLHAQRQLLGRTFGDGERSTLFAMLEDILHNNLEADAVGINGPVLHALWTLHGMRQFEADPARWDTVLKRLLVHPAWSVRRNVPLAMPPTPASAEALKSQCAANDPHPHVRIQVLDALARMPAPPSGPVPVASRHRTTDSHSIDAFAAAGTTRVVEVPDGALPANCPELPVAEISGPSAQRTAGRHALRIDIRPGGFLLRPHGQLPSGKLVVRDVRGHIAFRSSYQTSTATWSVAEAKGLNHPLYFYSFHGVNGDSFQGRIVVRRQ